MKLNQRQVQHLYHRAGFGASFSEVKKAIGKSADKLFDELFAPAENPEYIKVFEFQEGLFAKFKDADKEARKAMLKTAREGVIDLNLLWLAQMVRTKGFLREKMTLFWHDHFASESKNPYFAQRQNNLLRQHALGNFRDLLFAISKDQVMLKYLNNQQNRKKSPNENFAREVMELFTLGRGNYTETDIKEAARAFTGWGFNRQGDFVFRSKQHDYDKKTVFGKTGRFDGKDMLNMLLAQKQTARYLSTKIYQYFVNPKIDEARINQLADIFYQSDYDIKSLLKAIFTSDWFYDDEHIGKRIKSPIEFVASLQKTFFLQFEDAMAPLFIQKVLGQILFKPPNVAGWPDGKSWIDSSTLMFRLKIPEVIFRSHEFALAAKASGDAFDDLRRLRQFKSLKTSINWDAFSAQFKKVKDHKLANVLGNYLIQTKTDVSIVKSSATNRHDQLKDLVLNFTKLPDYQLC
ncbi:MAG: DUF1800 domain-containing protein [Flammeovirgaceae bacterium]